MKKQITIILILILTTIFGCKNHNIFLEVEKLSEFQNTQFIPTLEHEISIDKNSVYCSTLLFAWDKIRNQINSPFTIPNEYIDLNMLNNSTSFENVLKDDEYEVSGEIDGEFISARAEFNKSLAFDQKLESFNNKLIFDGQKISSFGVYGYSSSKQLEIVKIIYYKNDNNFIIKLKPNDKAHEIILFKTDKIFNSIAEMTIEIEKLTKIGITEMTNEKKIGDIFLMRKISWSYLSSALILKRIIARYKAINLTQANKIFK